MKSLLSAITFFAIVGIVFSSCGGNNSSSGAEAVTEEVKQKKQSPEEMGDGIIMI